MMERNEILDELEDMEDQLQQAIARIAQVERELEGGTSERLRQVRAQLEMAMSEDNEWMGRSMYTLSAVIDEVRAGDAR